MTGQLNLTLTTTNVLLHGQLASENIDRIPETGQTYVTGERADITLVGCPGVPPHVLGVLGVVVGADSAGHGLSRFLTDGATVFVWPSMKVGVIGEAATLRAARPAGGAWVFGPGVLHG